MAGLLSAFSGNFEIHPKTAEVVIMPLDDNGKEDNDLGGKKILQYWPSSLTTARSANWQSRQIPGAPLPLYQWVSGSDRTFNFTAMFSRDMDGEIGTDVAEDKYNVDVDAAIAWLNLLSWNDYKDLGDAGKIAVAPPVLWLYFTGTKLGYNRQAISSLRHEGDGIYCILLEVGEERSNWFQGGTVRLASVSLNFAEVMQIGGAIYPYGRSDFKSMADKYTRRKSS